MTGAFSIYALRLCGDSEVRYVGQTMQRIEDRLRGHIQYANNHGIATTYTVWILDNWRTIEAVKIAEAATRQEALVLEAQLIGVMSALGHRLFNKHHVSYFARIPDRPRGDPRFAMRHKRLRIDLFENPQLARAGKAAA